MDRAAIGIEHALVHRFRQGRMREDRVDKLRLGRFAIHGDDEALDKLRYLGADEMGAEKFPALRIKNCFGESVGLTKRNGLAIADKWKAANFDLITLLPRLGLREAD